MDTSCTHPGLGNEGGSSHLTLGRTELSQVKLGTPPDASRCHQENIFRGAVDNVYPLREHPSSMPSHQPSTLRASTAGFPASSRASVGPSASAVSKVAMTAENQWRAGLVRALGLCIGGWALTRHLLEEVLVIVQFHI